MAEMTKEEAIEYVSMMLEVVNREEGTSLAEMAQWTMKELHERYFPYSGVAYDAMVASTLILASALSMGASSVIGGMFSSYLGTHVVSIATLPRTVQWALRGLEMAGVYAMFGMGREVVENALAIPVARDLPATTNDVDEWIAKLVKGTSLDEGVTAEEYATGVLDREDALKAERLKRAFANNEIDINKDGKVNLRDSSLILKYGSVEAAIEALYGVSQRAEDIPGGVDSDLGVYGDDEYPIDEFDIDSRRNGSPRKTGTVRGYPEPQKSEGVGNMGYYQGGYQRRGGKWMTVQPGTPGAFPSKINPGQWIMRRRY